MSVQLVRPSLRWQARFLAAVADSAKLHHPWVYPPSTATGYAAYIKRCRSSNFAGHLLCTENGDLAGVINISEIVRGAFCNGYVGYYAFLPYAGCGLMKLGLQLLVRRAFTELGLHRLEVNVQPDNVPSLALARSAGFRREGFSPRYLRIGTEWKDHERWALTIEDWHAPDGKAKSCSE